MKTQVKEKGLQESLSPQAKIQVDDNVGRVKIDFYTDPLCCWSWAFEQGWRQLLEKYAGNIISYRYVLCGMIADWNSYNDAMNSVSRPLQMGPVWMHASEVTHVKMRYDIWHIDPPSSSYPACIAVKTAGLQSADAADHYLLAIRRSLMEEGLNISKQDVLFSIARTVPAIDSERFQQDWNLGLGKVAFREDMQQAKFHGIGRYPTLTFQNEGGEGFMIVGYRPFQALEEAFQKIITASAKKSDV